MCSIYVHADPMQYESRTRSIRIDNVVTTIRLENQFWDVLAEMAEKEGQTTNQLVSTLHGELFALREHAQFRFVPAGVLPALSIAATGGRNGASRHRHPHAASAVDRVIAAPLSGWPERAARRVAAAACMAWLDAPVARLLNR